MDYESPLDLSRIVESAEARHQVMNATSMPKIFIWATFESIMSESERNDMTEDVKSLCSEIPILKMKTQMMEEEEFMEKIEEAAGCYGQAGRKKRSSSRRASCSTCCKSKTKRNKRSAENSFGTNRLIHLIVGHKKFGC